MAVVGNWHQALVSIHPMNMAVTAYKGVTHLFLLALAVTCHHLFAKLTTTSHDFKPWALKCQRLTTTTYTFLNCRKIVTSEIMASQIIIDHYYKPSDKGEF